MHEQFEKEERKGEGIKAANLYDKGGRKLMIHYVNCGLKS
jgi:hypothetical protein